MIRPLLLSLLATPLLVLALESGKPFAATPLMTDETQTTVRLLENLHFNARTLTTADFQKLVPDYMAELDTQRLFFTAADRDLLLKKYRERLNKDLHYLGNLDAAFETFTLFRTRVQERVAWIQEQLKGDWDFTAKEEYAFDRTKAEWPASTAEADTLWRRRLKFELLEDLLNDKTLDTARETVRKRYERARKNVDEVDAEEAQETYLTTLTKMLDPHTNYMSPSTLEDFSMQMRLSLVGIGAQLSDIDGTCTVRELIPGGPADLGKQLKPNDKIVGVAQGNGEFVDVVGLKLRKVVDLIRGEKGTTVRLSIIPADATDTAMRKELRIVRDVVKLNASRATASIHEVPTADGHTIAVGVIDLPSFYGLGDDDSPGAERITATRDCEQLIRKLMAAKVEGLVLDLRRNGGGILSEAVELTGLFIAEGPVVQVKNSNGQIGVLSDENRRTLWNGPLAVLTSRYSASASEIVAGALQNYGRAIVVGDNSTHGKGTVQAIIPLSDWVRPRGVATALRTGATKMTRQKFYLPSGSSTQNRGVVPDITLPSIEEFLPIGESDLPNALPWDTIPTARFDGQPLDATFLARIREKSQARQALTEEFAFLRKNIARFKERDERKSISLNLEDRKKQKIDDDAWRDAVKKHRAELAKLNYANREVLLDGVDPAKNKDTGAPADEETKDDDKVVFDIQLREGLRVLTDAIETWKKPESWQSEGRTVAANAPNKFAPIP